jgi:hypothetical protein
LTSALPCWHHRHLSKLNFENYTTDAVETEFYSVFFKVSAAIDYTIFHYKPEGGRRKQGIM